MKSLAIGVGFVLATLLSGCQQQIKYLSSSDKVYFVSEGSKIQDPSGSEVICSYDGYLISQGTLLELYEAARLDMVEEQ